MTVTELIVGTTTVGLLVVVSLQTWGGFTRVAEETSQVNEVVEAAIRFRRESGPSLEFVTEYTGNDGSRFLRTACNQDVLGMNLATIVNGGGNLGVPVSSGSVEPDRIQISSIDSDDLGLWRVYFGNVPGAPQIGTIRVTKSDPSGLEELDQLFEYSKRQRRGQDTLFQRVLYYDRMYCDESAVN